MPNPNKKTAQRGIVAAAATALVVGSSFMPAVAAPEATSSPSVSQKSTPSASSTESAVDTTGLPEAIERDLDKTVDEYLEDSKANETAATVDKALKKEGIATRTSVENGKAKVKVSEKDAEKAKKIVAATKAAVSLEINTNNLSTAKGVYGELAENVDDNELTRLTAIVETKVKGQDVVKIIASGPGSIEGSKTLAPKKSAGTGDLSLEEFAKEAKSDVVLEASDKDSKGAAKPGASEDIYGGMGYAMTQAGQEPQSRCSIGFNAWDANGKDAILSAGHCTEDGAMTDTFVLEANAPSDFLGYTDPLGTFGFAQFGGPNNSGYPMDATWDDVDTENPGTDISVIKDINADLNLHAGVSQWPAGGDERDKVLNVTGVSAGTVGAEACSSGATTGWSCSTITGEGIFFVLGYDNTLRDVWGYTADNPGQKVLDQGDSGGAVLIGNKAVGINSANGAGEDGSENTADDLAMYTSLDDVVKKGYVKGYTVKLFINAPALTTETGAEVEAGSKISGTVKDASSGTQVDVIVDGKVVDTVTVDSNGKFSFDAPEKTGAYEFTLQAHKGFDKSATTQGNVVVIAVPTPTPTEEPTATPTEPTVEPTEPTEPTVEPTEPTVEPTEPTVEPTEPTVEPTEPTESATPTETPTEEPTESATPTETPTDEPTESATPTDEPTESATPSETATEEPTESATPTETKTPTTEPSESETEKSSEAPKDDKSDEPSKSSTPKETPKKKDPLADTGSSSAPLIAAGGALALVGAMFLLFRRGNRRHG
ncbi:LPXTG cell wall anchor domain-containing protein [Glutamicibacter sp.]|uniref:LPXTG cell wall anchor domain-containing protein n=1 Tax=Glutamicibacter sp. TaxID=1931995 RepID=UPI002FE3EAEE